MSTRTRIILRLENGMFIFGAAAVRVLINRAIPNGFMRVQLPFNWSEMRKRDKLLWLSKLPGVNAGLELFQEPRRTRKSKSLYWASRKKIPPPFPNPVAPVEQGYINFQAMDAVLGAPAPDEQF